MTRFVGLTQETISQVMLQLCGYSGQEIKITLTFNNVLANIGKPTVFVDTGKGLSCLVAQDWQLHHFIGVLDCQTKIILVLLEIGARRQMSQQM